jgi:predicted DNA-binding WGR domain protein
MVDPDQREKILGVTYEFRFRKAIGLGERKAESVRGRTAMALAHLHRIDPEANMARFYCIDVAATLFGDVSVLRTWGRIGTHGRTSFETCATVEEAERAAASQTLRQKMRRGYLPAGQMLPPDLAV